MSEPSYLDAAGAGQKFNDPEIVDAVVKALGRGMQMDGSATEFARREAAMAYLQRRGHDLTDIARWLSCTFVNDPLEPLLGRIFFGRDFRTRPPLGANFVYEVVNPGQFDVSVRVTKADGEVLKGHKIYVLLGPPGSPVNEALPTPSPRHKRVTGRGPALAEAKKGLRSVYPKGRPPDKEVEDMRADLEGAGYAVTLRSLQRALPTAWQDA